MGLMISAVTFLSVLEWIGYIIVALLCLLFMIVVHELGHYSVGKALGFKIDQFSIGFGPAILKHTSKKTGEIFALRCIPLGGYCAFHGETGDDNGDVALSPDDFNSHAPWKRIIVFIAGAFFNFMSAIIIISIFFMAYGDFVPKVGTVGVFYGENAGDVQYFQEGDVIVAVEGNSIYSLVNPNDFANQMNKVGDGVEVTVLRNDEKIDINVNRGQYTMVDPETGELFVDEDGVLKIFDGFGIGGLAMERQRFGFFESVGRSFVFIFKIIGVLFATLGGVITGALGISENLGGTITAISTIASVTRVGFEGVLYAVCVLSATLSVMNMLPLPALDGSHVVFTTIEWLRGKPINRKVENAIHAVGLICLFAMTIILDIMHFVG